MVDLAFGSEYEQNIVRKQFGIRPRTWYWVTLAFHTNNGTAELAAERKIAETFSKPDLRIWNSDLTEAEIPFLVIFQPVIVKPFPTFVTGEDCFGELGSNPSLDCSQPFAKKKGVDGRSCQD